MACAAAITIVNLAAINGCASSGHPESGTPQKVAIQSFEFLPEMWGDSAAQAQVLCQDGAMPTPVPGGTLWTFGDTFMGVRQSDGTPQFDGALSNTMAFVKRGTKGWPPRLEYFAGKDARAMSPLSLLADEDPKVRRLWPLAGVWLEHAGADRRGRAYMFYGLIRVISEGPWGFQPEGTGLACAEKPFGPYERLNPQRGGWPIDASSLLRRDGFLYLYAPRKFKGAQDLSSGLLIARVREEDIERPAMYEFFAGISSGAPMWGNFREAVPAAEEVWGQASVAWNEYLKAYVLATSSSIFRHDEIQLRAAPTPWGPWTPIGTNGGVIKVPERTGEETQLIYCAMLHPELDEEKGRILTLSFCRMLKRPWALTNPEGVKIRLTD